MKTIASGILAAVVIAVLAGLVLPRLQEPVYEVYATSSTRVGEPGSNLVGQRWDGNPRTRVP